MRATVGNKIREVRMRKGITQTELANGLVTPSMISQIEADKANPSYSLLFAISERLETPLEYFLTDVQNQLEKTSMFRLAVSYITGQQANDAIPLLRRLLEDDPPVIPVLDVTFYLAVALLQIGDIKEAKIKFEYVLENSVLQENEERMIQCYIELGNLEFQDNEYPTAIHHWRRGYTHAKERSYMDRYQLAKICRLLAMAYEKIGDLDQKKKYFAEANQCLQPSETLYDIAKTYRNMAKMAHELKHFDSAIEYATTAVVLSKRADSQKDMLSVQIEYGTFLGKKGMMDEAVEFLQSTAERAGVLGQFEEQGKACITIAEFFFQKPDMEQALFFAEVALQVIPEQTLLRANALYLLAEIYQKSAETDKALDTYKQAQEIYQELGNAQGLMKCSSHLGILYSNIGEYHRASDSLEQMRTALEQLLHERRVIS